MASDAAAERARSEPDPTRDETELGVDPNILAALAYVFNLVGALVLLVLEDNEYVRHHAAQALLFTAVVVAARFVVGVLGAVFGLFRLGFLISPLSFAVWAGAVLGFLLLAYKAYTGTRYELPVLGAYVADVEGAF